MHVCCSRSSLFPALQIAHTPRMRTPQAHSMHIRAASGTLTLTGSDPDCTVTVVIPADVSVSGDVVLPGRYLHELVRRIPTENIELKHDRESRKLEILYGENRAVIYSYSEADFIFPPEQDEFLALSLDSRVLYEAIVSVSPAAMREELQGIFSGVLLHPEPSGCLNLVATDTHRLAWKAVPVTGRIEPPADRHYIVPARVLGEVARVLEQEEYTSALVELSFQATQVVFKLPKVVITCRVLEGKFPHYAQFIPENFVSRVCVPAGDLRLALERALLLAREDSRLKTNIVKLTLRGEVLNVRGSAAEVGYLEEQIPVEKEGEDLEIYFNIQYLLDILRVYPREEFQLLFTSDARSLVMRPRQDNSYAYLVLPIRVS